MSNYDYKILKEEGKFRLGYELRKRGWELVGYKEDYLGFYDDYPTPEEWYGICRKNGFVLCIGISEFEVEEYGGKRIYEEDYYPELVYRENDEEELYQYRNKKEERDVCTVYPVFQMHPKKATWHIEKDGVIYAKGNGISKFAHVPPTEMFDIDTMKFKEDYEEERYYNGERFIGKLTEKEEEAVKSFKKLVVKLEQIVNDEFELKKIY